MRRGDLVKYTGLNGGVPEGSFGITGDDWPSSQTVEVFWGDGLATHTLQSSLENVKIPNTDSDANFAEILK